MELCFTRHARNRMRLYGIALQEVESTVKHPQQLMEAAFGAHQAWKPRSVGGWLRVTFKDEGARRIVITVTPKRAPPGGRHAN
jgi:hypothetical protein